MQVSRSETGQDDILLVLQTTSRYQNILEKVFALFKYAAVRGAQFVLKTDDDAYVNVPALVQVLLTVSLF